MALEPEVPCCEHSELEHLVGAEHPEWAYCLPCYLGYRNGEHSDQALAFHNWRNRGTRDSNELMRSAIAETTRQLFPDAPGWLLP